MSDPIPTQPDPAPRRPSPRPFPWGSIAIITIGVLLVLLAFAITLLVYPSAPGGRWFSKFGVTELELEQVRRQEAQAMAEMARQEARLAEEKLKVAQHEAVVAQEKLKQAEIDLENARKQIEELRLAKNEVPPAPVEKWGTLEGRVTFKGSLPKLEPVIIDVEIDPRIRKIFNVAPKDHYLEPTWRIDAKTRGVANVAVFLKRPKDGVWPIHDDDKIRKETKTLDAPFLMFEPHVLATYPEWFDGQKRGSTGQKFALKNSSALAFSVRVFGQPEHNPGLNVNVPPGEEHVQTLKPQQTPLDAQSGGITFWMTGKVFVFDHPYFAITKADGTFTIPRVPAGMEVQVMAWHESQGWLPTKDGKTMKLKGGTNTLDFEIGAK